jgi:hypothetical protein
MIRKLFKMIRNAIKKQLLLSVMLIIWSSNLASATKWTNEICSGDNMMVTFSKCCGNEPYCSANTNEADCNKGEVGLYCEWIETNEVQDASGKCIPKTDERSDVCCRGGAVKDACHSIAYKMECPKDWLVSEGCCPDASERKYNKILGGIPEDMDCCNSPCTQVEKAISSGSTNCTLSPRCAPGARSYAMTYDPYNTLGFFHSLGHGAPHSFGNIIHGSGYDDFEYEEEDTKKDGYDDKHDDKYGHVDEITVDDLFELMIEALQDDSDVKSYDAEYYTDPYLGKTRSGGLLADFDLPDPDYYFKLLYGNPWGLSYNLENEFKDPSLIYSSPDHYGYGYNDFGSQYGHGYGYNGLQSPYGYGHSNQFSPYGFGHQSQYSPFGFGHNSPYSHGPSSHGNY